MPQSLSKVVIHLIFSTKHREPFIHDGIRERLHGYLVGILANLKSSSIQTGGVDDHVHILCTLGRTLTQADLVEEVKRGSSKWMKSDGGIPSFTWQAGYGAFSVSESQVDAVVHYIRNQDEHHRTVSFQDEYRAFLKRHNIGYDEKYVWD